MSISSCPACSKQVTIPAGLGTTARVRCPLCHSQYTLADALVNMPPLLELVEEAPSEWNDLQGNETEALGGDQTLDFIPEMNDDRDAGPDAFGLSEPIAASEGDEPAIDDNDTEIEVLGFAASEPLVREVPGDDDPLEMAMAHDDGSVLDFDAESTPLVDAAKSPSEEASVEEEIAFDFAEPAQADAAGGETVAGDDLVFDLDATEAFDEPVETMEFNPVTAVPQDTGEEVELDFGEPVGSEAGAPQADAAAADEEGIDEDPKGKKKKKKEKKPPKVKVPREPGQKRSLSTVLGVVAAALVALPLTLYGMVWINPDYDFFKIGSVLPKAMLPSAMSKPKYVAAKPAMPIDSAALAQLAQRKSAERTESQAPAAPATDSPPPTDATQPPAGPATGPSLEPENAAPPAAEPAPAATPPSEPVDESPPLPEADQRAMPEKPSLPNEPAADAPSPPSETPAPADTDSPLDSAAPTETPAEPATAEVAPPAHATDFSVGEVAKAMEAAQAANQKMVAAQAANDEAQLKKARSNFYLSVFRLAEAVTFVDQAAGRTACRSPATGESRNRADCR